ncbi:family 43 glycosylhydrolase [Gilvimarinus sp. DA14]|uniref:family 43 glycosylhydrolase n=1 Tax=Gilvimarinus sp. DA14 TaxID=2956798 RepID=UPI0020B7B075|nr:family 43 glycosylhydrolase [Gilvimarinus sp. DA14]UTF60632.1 family 43 glycosylhydrolase [Gilvimarinus sp. DA14]
MNPTRRTLFKAALAGAATPALAAGASAKPCPPPLPQHNHGVEGQRVADLGNGMFLNPIVSGDHPDPTILKDGDDYYMTFSSFNAYPGIVIWHSKDLLNWTPVTAALTQNIGTVWALDLCKHGDRYYVYIPALPPGKGWGTYVIWADDIAGPWSDPVDMKLDNCIDPGHAVGEDGKRYLFVNGIRKVRLTDDGLATDGELEPAYSPWRYPEHWITENFAPEGPKLLYRNGYHYLVTAVGGTAGPVTGHMVIAARSRSIHGPWEHCPHNPLVRTLSEDEPWWSRGHATLVEGPGEQWWMVYHGYENGYRTLGRQTLMEPIEWTDDGWFKALGGDLSQPLPAPQKPANYNSGTFALSDDFSENKLGIQWSFDSPKVAAEQRARYGDKRLLLTADGNGPADTSPLTCFPADHAYQVEVNLDIEDDAEAGILLFYNHKAYVGLGFTKDVVKNYQYAEEHPWAAVQIPSRSVRVRLINDKHVVTYQYSHDGGKSWRTHPTRMEVSGIHHNVFGGFLSLRVALYCSGEGQVALSDFTYRALS